MIDEQIYLDYLNALLDGDRSRCREIVQALLDKGVDIKQLYENLFHRSMYEVGHLWENNRITVAREHLATSISESLLNLIHPYIFDRERVGKTAVISCAANEFHQLGGKIVADIFELNGWNGHFLGANTPAEVMNQLIQEKKPDIVGLSLSILSNGETLRRTIEIIKTDFSAVDILVGGQAFRRGGLDMIKAYPGTEYIPTLDELENMIKTALNHGSI